MGRHRSPRCVSTSVANGCAQILRRRSVEASFNTQEEPAGEADLPSHLVELQLALGELTERQRIVVVLRYFVDLPDKEIAALLDVRPATVRSLTRRALIELRKELG